MDLHPSSEAPNGTCSEFVAGMTSRAGRAIENVRAICDKYLTGRYDLEVIDIYQQPSLAKVSRSSQRRP